MKKKTLFIVIAAFAVLVVVMLVFSRKKEGVEVTVEQVARRQLVETVTASGKIQPASEVKVQSEVSGQIIDLPVKEGDYVQKGQLLVRINPDLYQSALNRAEAALNGARSSLATSRARLAQSEAQFTVQQLNYDRMRKLFADKAVSQSELDNATGTFETAKAELVAAQESIRAADFSVQSAEATRNEASDNLRRTSIVAPMSGTVTALSKQVGETVLGNNMMSGDVIMRVSALQLMEVNVEVNESDIVRIHLGDTASIEVDAFRDESFLGIVSEIGNTALNASGSGMISMDQVTNFSVKIQMMRETYLHHCKGQEEHYSPFRPGMSATVEVRTARADNVLSVPVKAITSRDDTTAITLVEKARMKREGATASQAGPVQQSGGPYTVVFLQDQTSGKATIRVVKTGIQDDRYIEVLEGIDEEDYVITGPYETLSRKLNSGELTVLRGNSK